MLYIPLVVVLLLYALSLVAGTSYALNALFGELSLDDNSFWNKIFSSRIFLFVRRNLFTLLILLAFASIYMPEWAYKLVWALYIYVGGLGSFFFVIKKCIYAKETLTFAFWGFMSLATAIMTLSCSWLYSTYLFSSAF